MNAMTHRDLPLGSDVKWCPSLISDASCCSQLVQLGLEKDRETEGLSPSEIRFLVLFLKESSLFDCFLWAHEHVKYIQQICQTFHLACQVKKPSKVKLIIDSRCSQSTRAQAVTFTALDVTLSDCLSQIRLIASALDARLAGRSGMVVGEKKNLRCEMKLTEGVRSARTAC